METLKKSRDYRNVIEGGKREILETIIIYRLPNQMKTTRVGISVSGKTGSSVKRNRTKRRIKEAIRKNASFLPGGEDVVIVARKAGGRAGYSRIEEDLRKMGRGKSVEGKDI